MREVWDLAAGSWEGDLSWDWRFAARPDAAIPELSVTPKRQSGDSERQNAKAMKTAAR